eukprot:CAMPEP_0184732398 /NCGR_PEP_ID=MMETSP0314-20130426/54157_1 /TAXON_ID=38298 /ORGANISM="Rhodella maculata, Strain CCMP 736" /LENGTH=138 /DNA_ID=CAMNT_0027198977 /DNA_START=15 /DNA_END=431 /DNA_ORIENTATION=-
MKTPSSSSRPQKKLFLRLRIAAPASSTDECSPADVSVTADPELCLPASPRFPDADRFSPRTNVEMFGSEYSNARDLGMQLSPRNNKQTEFEKQMASEKKAKRYVRSKDSNKGVIRRAGERKKNTSDVTDDEPTWTSLT